eukprot:276061-Amorphochlora_amoeboformis.AAC.1
MLDVLAARCCDSWLGDGCASHNATNATRELVLSSQSVWPMALMLHAFVDLTRYALDVAHHSVA